MNEWTRNVSDDERINIRLLQTHLWGRMTRRRRREPKAHVEKQHPQEGGREAEKWKSAEEKIKKKMAHTEEDVSPGRTRRIPTCERGEPRMGDQDERQSGLREIGRASCRERV